MAKLGEKVKIFPVGEKVVREKGYLYYIDKEGDISRSPQWSKWRKEHGESK